MTPKSRLFQCSYTEANKLAMVQRYSHLALEHLWEAVERQVPAAPGGALRAVQAPYGTTRKLRLPRGGGGRCIVSPRAPVAQPDRASAF
jgi:hypothetical protein